MYGPALPDEARNALAEAIKRLSDQGLQELLRFTERDYEEVTAPRIYELIEAEVSARSEVASGSGTQAKD